MYIPCVFKVRLLSGIRAGISGNQFKLNTRKCLYFQSDFMGKFCVMLQHNAVKFEQSKLLIISNKQANYTISRCES